MTTDFTGFGLPQPLLDSLARLNFQAPTPIQAQALPPALTGQDVLGSAQTGTGKTGAFVIPMLAKLMNDPQARAIVLTPTRELATQVQSVIRDMLGAHIQIKTALLIGGDSMMKQVSQLKAKPRIIIGTPGRTNDHLRQFRDLLKDVSFAVLDEADRMLDMGFSKQIDDILAKMTGPRQMLMFSATFPDNIIKFSKTYLNNPVRVSVGSSTKAHENIQHEMVSVTNDSKYNELQAQLTARDGSIIVFVKTKHGADKMAEKLSRDGYMADALHGGLRQRARDKAVRTFREKKTRILVATDVAARGLDIPHVEHVVNYDMPQVAEDYIHRMGRTARAGAKGQAVALVTPSDRGLWNDVNRLLNPNAAPMKYEGGVRPASPKRGGRRPDYNRSDRRPGDRPDRSDQKRGQFRKAPARRDDRGYAASDTRPSSRPDYQRDARADHRSEPRSGQRADTRSEDRGYRRSEPRTQEPRKPDYRRPEDRKPYGERRSSPEGQNQNQRSDRHAPRSSESAHSETRAPRDPNARKPEFKKSGGKAPFKFKQHRRAPTRAA
ncbi:MAG: DEAD/DEAH box helicase [Alphaproteobacteria bacterium]|nr:DEAD/DEAH box helicase [Alphaproteobacteria bacterium]